MPLLQQGFLGVLGFVADVDVGLHPLQDLLLAHAVDTGLGYAFAVLADLKLAGEPGRDHDLGPVLGNRIERGQQRSQTLSGTGGGAAPTEMTASRLLAMSNDEFDAWTTKNPAKAARLMGEDEPRRRRA